ncbi:MAG TPA: helix-turn-helix domain-containing protein, partial [Gemmatimonadaceae bacterium]|nr:helix-turn-helix domain-containing protein [Gemmatimonadaceae bacterium]
IAPSALPDRVVTQSAEPFITEREHTEPTLEVVERAYIKWVLDTHGGNKTKAAETLGIDPSTLHRKLQRYL